MVFVGHQPVSLGCANFTLHMVITKTCLFKYTENFTTKKIKIFQIKNSDIFQFFAQNIDCGYPQSMFLRRNKKNNVYPCKPQFYYIKVGFQGVKLYRHVFVMAKMFK